MIRRLIVMSLMVLISAAANAEMDPTQVTHMALAQLQDCIDRPVAQVIGLPEAGAGNGLSFRGLGATLGIGVMTLLFFVPAALLSELLMRRAKSDDFQE